MSTSSTTNIFSITLALSFDSKFSPSFPKFCLSIIFYFDQHSVIGKRYVQLLLIFWPQQPIWKEKDPNESPWLVLGNKKNFSGDFNDLFSLKIKASSVQYSKLCLIWETRGQIKYNLQVNTWQMKQLLVP